MGDREEITILVVEVVITDDIDNTVERLWIVANTTLKVLCVGFGGVVAAKSQIYAVDLKALVESP